MSRLKNKKELSLIKILIVILIILLILTAIINISSRNKKNNNNTGSSEISISKEKIDIQENDEELQKVKSMSERNRIEYYVSQYIKLLEEQKYDEAYSLLNSDYKKNYFKTQKDFEEYCKEKFSSMLNVKYDNFERNGEIYVLWLTITDAIKGNKTSGEQINFVVKENSFNNYELSFSKI